MNDQLCRETLALVRQYGNASAAAPAAGITSGSMRERVRAARAFAEKNRVGLAPQPFEIAALPSSQRSLTEILESRTTEFRRKHEAKEARRLIPVRVNLRGPIGIAHFGDPHVDDAGTDISLLRSHLEAVSACEGMFAGNVGDTTNNWVGRLAALHAKQTTTGDEAWTLAEWLIRSAHWLYLIGGNHDVWSGAGDPLKWMAAQSGNVYEPNGARLELQFPNGNKVRVNARHTFPGNSQWNAAHGIGKAVQMGFRDHVLACGHIHTSGYMILKDPATGLVSHALQVASYKTHDDYADTNGFRDGNIFCCPVTIIKPEFAETDPRMVTTLFDPLEAVDYLTWLRARKTPERVAPLRKAA